MEPSTVQSGALLDSPWLILGPLLLVTPLILSGAVRCALHVSLPVALAVATLAVGTALAALRPVRASLAVRGWPRAAALSLLLVFSTLLVALLYAPAYGGMVSGPYGVDAGNHAGFFGDFVGSDPSTYHGFVGLYALMYWLRPIAGGTFAALRASFYLAILAMPFSVAVGVAMATGDLAQCRRARWPVLAGIGAFGVYLFASIVVPILHYNQANGFYSHLLGIYPFFFAWISYGLIEEPRRRAVVLVAWLGLLRYVYALNLGELIVAAIVLVAIDLRRDPARIARWICGVGCVAAVVVAAAFFRQLYPWALRDGYFPAYEYRWVLPALLAGGLVMLAAPRLARRAGIPLPPPVLRLVRFASVFILLNLAAALAFLAGGNPTQYYFQKYLLFPVLLSCCVALVLVAHVASSVTLRGWGPWLRSRAGLRAVGVIGATTALVTVAFSHGFGVYREPRSFEALFDPDADRVISQVLQSSGKQFGGYLQPFFPRTYLMNAIRGQLTFGDYFARYDAFHDWKELFAERAGRCYFFEQPASAYRTERLAMAAQVEQLSDRSDKACVRYHRRWRPMELVELCSVCL